MSGARPEPGLLRRLLVPSAASAGVHLVLLIAVLAATITVAGRERPRGPLAEIATAVGAEADARQPVRAPPDATPLSSGGVGASADLPKPPPLESRLTGAVFDAAVAAPASASEALARAEPQVARSVSFAGVQAQAAGRIVYVVDASGSMVNSHAFVRARLIQSINRLSPTQRFTIILARTQPEAAGVEIMPSDGRDPLVRALPSSKAAAVEWMREVVVGGRSAPLEGLERALSLEPRPDLVFLLSRGFLRTGGAWPGVETALGELDALNPRSRRTGQRAVVVKTLQFLDDDPTGLMQAIGEAQGDGPGSFRVLTLDDLSATEAEDDAIPADAVSDAALARARGILAGVDGDALDVLYGLGLADSRVRVGEAVRLAREALGPRLGPGDALGASVRARIDLLEAAASGDTGGAKSVADVLDEMFVVEAEGDAARRLALAGALAMAGEVGAAQAVADGLESDLVPLGLSGAVGSELAVLRARFGLSGRDGVGPGWSLLRAKARMRHAIETEGPGERAFAPLLEWGELDPSRAGVTWRLIAEFTDTLEAETVLPWDVLFARAMGLADARPAESVSILLTLAEREPGSARAREALWEACSVLGRLEPARAAGALELFARRWPDDDRSPGALAAAVALTPTDSPDLLARLRLALERLARHADADRWRVRLAMLVDGPEALDALGEIGPGSPLMAQAADRVFEIARGPGADETMLRTASRLLRSLGDARWQLVHASLVSALLGSDAGSAAVEAERLDAQVPEFAFLLGRAQLAAGRRDEGLGTLRSLTERLGPDADLFWGSWTLLLDTLAEDPSQADTIRAHLFRLRLIDPEFEAGDADGATKSIADAPSEP